MFPQSDQKIQFICNFGKSLVKNKENNTHTHTLIQNYPDGCSSAERQEPNMKNRLQPTQSLRSDVMSLHKKKC